MMVRSFPDSGVLISAARSRPPFDLIAFNDLDDSSRVFLTSPLIRLETEPKASYMGRSEEFAFYQEFFASPDRRVVLGLGKDGGDRLAGGPRSRSERFRCDACGSFAFVGGRRIDDD